MGCIVFPARTCGSGEQPHIGTVLVFEKLSNRGVGTSTWVLAESDVGNSAPTPAVSARDVLRAPEGVCGFAFGPTGSA